MRSRVGLIVLVVALSAISFATLLPGGAPLRPLPQFCLICGELGGVDFVLNVLLFIPYGVGLYLLLDRRWRSVAIGFLTSLTIELLQLRVIPDRDSSLGDLTSNTLGTAIGIFLTAGWEYWLRPTPRVARILSWSSLAVWGGLLSLSAWALQPSLTNSPWYGQWMPVLAQYGVFQGQLLSASLDGAPLPSGRLTDQTEAHRNFAERRTALSATVITGWRLYPGTVGPIVSIYNGDQQEQVLLGQQGVSLIFRTRTHSSDLRLREPTIGLNLVFPRSTQRRPNGRPGDGSRLGDTVQVSGERIGGTIRLSATSPSQTKIREYPLNTFLLWNSILPFNLSIGYGMDVLSTLWAFGLMLFPAYWFAWRSDRARAAPLFGGAIVVGLTLIPRAFGLPISPWWAWVGSAIAIGLGLLTVYAWRGGTGHDGISAS